MSSMLAPLVGSYFRPPARLVLEILPEGQPLILQPEPFNEYDSDAIKVIVRVSDIVIPTDQADKIAQDLVGYGSSMEDFVTRNEVHLGYIPKSGGKFANIDGQPSKGNAEFLNIIGNTSEWKAELTFSPSGKPLVKLTW